MDDEEIEYAGQLLFPGVDLTLWFAIALSLAVSLVVCAVVILVIA